MTTTTRTGRVFLLTLVCTAALAAVPARAVDEPTEAMAGRVTVVKAGKLAKFTAKPPVTGGVFDLPDAGNAPTVGGGRLRFVDLGDPAAGDVVYDLPFGGWKGLGNPPGSKGYRYKGAGSATDPCRTVLVKEKIVKGVCRGSAVDLGQPLDGDLGVVLTVGAASKRYCTTFGGTEIKNDGTITKRRSATAPACACGAVPPTQLSFANGVGTGVCGSVTDGTTTKEFDCGDLVIGGGNSPIPPSVFQDMVHPARFNVDCCVGDTLLLGETSEAAAGDLLECTTPGCYFGPPLPIVMPSTPQSACVYMRVTRGGTGLARCDTGEMKIDMEIHGEMFLTGDILPRRCSGGANPGLRCSTLGADPACTGGGTCVSDPDVQPCPICNPTTLVCNGGQNNGMACEPGSNQVVNPTVPTSHDCTVSTLAKLGEIPIPFSLSTGTTTITAFDSSSQTHVFCGFCRDADETLAFEEVTPGHPRPCTSDADCAQPFESCTQRSGGAFGPNGGNFTTATEIGTPAGNLEDYLPHTGTLAGIFCIAPTFIPLIDGTSDIPGPGAISFPNATFQLSSPSGAFLDGAARP